MKPLTKKRKTEIANEVLAEIDVFDSTPFRHLKGTVRKMLLEVIDKTLAEVTDGSGEE